MNLERRRSEITKICLRNNRVWKDKKLIKKTRSRNNRVWKDDKVIMYLFFSWNYINFNFKHLSVQKLFPGVRYTARFVSFFTNYGVRFIARLRHFRRVWRRGRAIARLVCRTLSMCRIAGEKRLITLGLHFQFEHAPVKNTDQAKLA